jgi:hypothetical protein
VAEFWNPTAGPAPVATCDWLGKRADCGTRSVRVQAHRAAGSWAAGMLSRFGPWGSVPADHVQADGQTILLHVRLDQKCLAELALPLSPGEFEPLPLSALSMPSSPLRSAPMSSCKSPVQDQTPRHRKHPAAVSAQHPRQRSALGQSERFYRWSRFSRVASTTWGYVPHPRAPTTLASHGCPTRAATRTWPTFRGLSRVAIARDAAGSRLDIRSGRAALDTVSVWRHGLHLLCTGQPGAGLGAAVYRW